MYIIQNCKHSEIVITRDWLLFIFKFLNYSRNCYDKFYKFVLALVKYAIMLIFVYLNANP